ncbi:hypothetical protein V8E51_000246 [Hyaloscypha variabilis]
MDRKLRKFQHQISRFASNISHFKGRLNAAKCTVSASKNKQNINNWLDYPSSVQNNNAKYQTTTMNTRITITKSLTTANRTRSQRPKQLAKRRQQLEHWMQVLASTKQQTSLAPMQQEEFITNTETTTSTQSINEDNDKSLSDLDVDLNDLESIHEDFGLSTSNEDADESIPPTTEEDFFANFDIDTPRNSPSTSNISELTTQLLSMALENQARPSESDLSTSSSTTSTRTESSTFDRRGESLSDLSVDVDDLESIPDDFIIPMFNEDGSPADTDSGSDTPSIASELIPEGSPAPEAIRNLVIAVQGNDVDVHIEEDFFPAPSNRIHLADITIASSYHNQNIVTSSTRFNSNETRQRQFQEFHRRYNQGDLTARVWPRRHLNQENARRYENDRPETEQERRRRIWAEERDEMIFGWNEDQIVRREGRRETREEVVRGERLNLLTPGHDSWTRHEMRIG